MLEEGAEGKEGIGIEGGMEECYGRDGGRDGGRREVLVDMRSKGRRRMVRGRKCAEGGRCKGDVGREVLGMREVLGRLK